MKKEKKNRIELCLNIGALIDAKINMTKIAPLLV